MKRLIVFTIILIVLASAAAQSRVREGWDDGLPDELKQDGLNVIPFSPETFDEKYAAATLIVRATVQEINPLEEWEVEKKGSARRMRTRIRKVAVLDVEEVYKGTYSGGTLTMEFYVSERREDPPLMDVDVGEEAVFFLVTGNTPPHYSPVSYHFGKSPATEGVIKRLTGGGGIEGETAGGAGQAAGAAGVTVNLAASRQQVGQGDPAYITIMVMNNSDGLVRVDASFNPGSILAVSGPAGAVGPKKDVPGIVENVIAIQPGHFAGARYDLAEYFDVSGEGVYFARADIRLLPGPGSAGARLSSEPVSIVVGQQGP